MKTHPRTRLGCLDRLALMLLLTSGLLGLGGLLIHPLMLLAALGFLAGLGIAAPALCLRIWRR